MKHATSVCTIIITWYISKLLAPFLFVHSSLCYLLFCLFITLLSSALGFHECFTYVVIILLNGIFMYLFMLKASEEQVIMYFHPFVWDLKEWRREGFDKVLCVTKVPQHEHFKHGHSKIQNFDAWKCSIYFFLLVASWMRLLNTCILELLAHHCHCSSPASKCSVQTVFSLSICCWLCVLYFHAYMYTCLHTCVHAHVCMHTCVYMYVYAIWLACSCKTSTSRYFVQFSWVQFCVREISTFVHVISLWITCFVNSFAFAGAYGH